MSDAYAPAEIALRVESAGVSKARAPAGRLLPLSILGGAFIALGCAASLVAVTGSAWGLGPTRILGGAVFSLGLVLVIVGGAELFTGNNLVAMAWASRRIGFEDLLRSWVWVYAGNLAGALGTAVLVRAGGMHRLGGGAVGETALAAARAKAALGAPEALALGILCNALVCLAVWLAMGGRSVADRILGIVLPVTAFVACGFEHCIANAFLLPYAWMLGAREPGFVEGAVRNLGLTTLGNLLGGTLLVAAVYWAAYLRGGASGTRPS